MATNNKLKLLLADTNNQWLEEAKAFFEPFDYEVHITNNGKKAQLLLYQHKFFLVVLNLEITNHPGLQVLRFIRSNHMGVKVIILMNDAKFQEENDLEKDTLAKQGIVDFLIHPINLKDLGDLVESKQDYSTIFNREAKKDGPSAEIEVQDEDTNYTSVKINDFVSGKCIQFNVYVKIGPKKYVKILHAGDSFSKERIDKYKNEKKVEYLYFHNDDRKKFMRMVNYVAEQSIDNSKVSTAVKVKLVKNVAEKFAQEAFTNGIASQVVEQGKQLMDNVYNMMQSNNDLHVLLRNYEDFDPGAYNHSFLVCLFSCMVVKQFEWQSKIVNETVGMAALLHDIGKTKLPLEIMHLRPHEMSPEQLVQYKEHPLLGVDILRQNPHVPSSVRQIIYQHHEIMDGSGFPNGHRGHKILTLSKILALCDEFVHLMEDEKIKPPAALKKMLNSTNITTRHHSSILENFIKIFVDPNPTG